MSDAGRNEAERELLAGLRRLADDTVVPPIDPAQEQRLLAAFDAHRTSQIAHSSARRRWTLAAAGLLAAAATLVWIVNARPTPAAPPTAVSIAKSESPAAAGTPVTVPPAVSTAAAPKPRLHRPQPRPLPRDPQASFVMWPGADDLPRFESGQLMRVELPASVVVSLGLRPSKQLRDDGVVQTDVLVGQDGYARAVRLVQ